MSFKKNGISWIIWLLFLIGIGSLTSWIGLHFANKFIADSMIIGILFIFIFYMGTLGFAFLIKWLSKSFVEKANKKQINVKRVKVKKISEEDLITLLITGGIVLRFLLLSSAGEEANFFEFSKITEEKNLISHVQSSVYLYLYLLRGLFFIFGNIWIVGIWAQIIMQSMGFIFICLSLRNFIGKNSAIMSLIFFVFSPSMIMAGITYSAKILYVLLFSVGLFLISLSYKYLVNNKKYNLVWVFFSAGIIGILGYLDISGFSLFFILLWVIFFSQNFLTIQRKILYLFGTLLIIGSVFCIAIFLDSLFTGASFQGILNAWMNVFQWKGIKFSDFNRVENFTGEVYVFLITLLLGVFSFLNRKVDSFSPFICLLFLQSFIYLFSIYGKDMDNFYLLLLSVSMLSGISISELFYVKKMEQSVEAYHGLNIEDISDCEDTEKSIKYIENPLPLPKKHVKKQMDYKIKVNDELNDYDIVVKGDDDYDID